MVHRNVYPRLETHRRLFDQIHGPSRQSTDRRPTCHIFAEKNVNRKIIRAILAYPPKEAPQTLEQWKVAITAVGQGYEWISIRYDYRTGSGITYGGIEKPMEIERGK